jgi:crotonobetainyl-CoA:carnitine CoA-transferase CaiB-like acyl-CoA transferase
MEKWHIGPADLGDHLVYVRISGFGQSGPYRDRTALNLVGLAMGGLLHLTGDADRPPVKPGPMIADQVCALFAAQAATALLFARESGRSGGVVDCALYASVLGLLEWTIPAYDQLGYSRSRTGNSEREAAPGGVFLTNDGAYVAIIASVQENFRRFCHAADSPGLLDDPRFADPAARAANADSINLLVGEWVATLSAREVMQKCTEFGVPTSLVYTPGEIVEDPHIHERSDLVTIADPELGDVLQMGPVVRFSSHSHRVVPSAAPRLGEHNEEVWRGEVGLSREEYRALQESGVI